ncbi:hypothetical protein [Aeromonas veronii]|uniref:hypothetical protein n=1 Tax=Aeromonas veronii TaxID=654 RepID=UPI0024165CD2|nr:hypothetical protein [Aeromonas veronii]WFO52681.1 hypothetical protein L1O00_06605 [Aeromonas veronii]
MIFFYAPFLYTFKTRLISIEKIISWGMIYIIPISIANFILNIEHNGFIDFFNLFLSFSLVYSLYELGYIYNDAVTIKNEAKPTLRLSIAELQFFYRHKITIVFIRVFIALLLSIFISNEYGVGVYLTWLLIPLYVGYNKIRSRWNLPLHFLLVTLRYSCPVLAVNGDVIVVFIMFVIFSLINLIERGGEKRFNFLFLQKSIFNNHDRFRCIYYGIMFIMAWGIYTWNQNSIAFYTLLVLTIYFFIYRTLLYLMVSIKGGR